MNQPKMLVQLLQSALGNVDVILHGSSIVLVVLKHLGKGRVGGEFCRFVRQRRRAVVMEAKSSDPTPAEEGQQAGCKMLQAVVPMEGGPTAIVLPPASTL